MKIAVIGSGYVGSSCAVLLSRRHAVSIFDINAERIAALSCGRSPIGDAEMERMLSHEELDLSATTDHAAALSGADYAVIATNTELDADTGRLNTASVESAVRAVAEHFCANEPEAGRKPPVIVIKSTVPTGYTQELKARFPQFTFLFCPEFLRERTAMLDALHPSRVIVGYDGGECESAARCFAQALLSCVEAQAVPLLFMGTAEAEAVKLFSNSYLAVRVAFFNELDSFAAHKGLNSASIIKGCCLDPRIGDFYNVPGPGFAGSCLPKDTRQLIADFGELPEELIRAALRANEQRKAFVASLS